MRSRVDASSRSDAEPSVPTSASPATPEGRIDDAVDDISADVELGLLERVVQLTPKAFEQIVVQLLTAIGYARHGRSRHTGGPGDGGIDGIILMDRLGLDRIYIQAKRLRLRALLSPDDVRAFGGVMQVRRAHRGVLCTSGRATDETCDIADRLGIRLIVGIELAKLMLEFGIGVRTEVRYVPRVDEDFFENFGRDAD